MNNINESPKPIGALISQVIAILAVKATVMFMAVFTSQMDWPHLAAGVANEEWRTDDYIAFGNPGKVVSMGNGLVVWLYLNAHEVYQHFY